MSPVLGTRAARFNRPRGVFVGPDGDVYVADTDNHLIRRVTPAGVVTTYAGGTMGYLDSASPLSATTPRTKRP